MFELRERYRQDVMRTTMGSTSRSVNLPKFEASWGAPKLKEPAVGRRLPLALARSCIVAMAFAIAPADIALSYICRGQRGSEMGGKEAMMVHGVG